MSDIAHHLVRRAVGVTQQHYAQTTVNGEGEPEFKQIAAWGFVLLWGTVLLYLALVSAVS